MESTVLNTEPYPLTDNPVLELYYHGMALVVLPDKTPFNIGRDNSESALSVTSEFASRQHCVIDYQSDKFVLRDASRNGTFLQINLTPAFRLHHESAPLVGNGCFKLGAAMGVNDPEVILFKLKSGAP